MAKYAFLVQGANDYELLTPKLRLRKHGCWLVTEKIQFNDIERANAFSQLKFAQLALKIMDETGLSEQDAAAAILSPDLDKLRVVAKFHDEINEYLATVPNDDRTLAKQMTIFMRSRAEGQMNDSEWTPLLDWSEDDTQVFTEDVSNKLATFISSERNGGRPVEDDDAGEDGAEGAEGKNPALSESSGNAPESSNTKTTGMPAMDASPLAA